MSTETKVAATPGPWLVVRNEWNGQPEEAISIMDAQREIYIAQAWSDFEREPDDPESEGLAPSGTAEANAHLIAAAPDLYGALTIGDCQQIIEAIENFVMGPTEDPELDAIWQPYIDKLSALSAAIQKADGR